MRVNVGNTNETKSYFINYVRMLGAEELKTCVVKRMGDGLSEIVNNLIGLMTKAFIQNLTKTLIAMMKATPLYEQSVLSSLSGTDWKTPYQLGRLNGAVTVMTQLAQKQSEDNDMDMARRAAPKYFDRILDHLGETGKDTQGEIAKLLNVSPSNLSNILKRMSASGIVYREEAGKFHYYHLTESGERYWKKQRCLRELVTCAGPDLEEPRVQLNAVFDDKMTWMNNENNWRVPPITPITVIDQKSMVFNLDNSAKPEGVKESLRDAVHEPVLV